MSEEGSKLKKNQRRESILETALEVMSEKGIEGTTMREIAKAEGISETLLYRFFRNKAEVFFGIIQSRAMKAFDGLEELVAMIKGMIPNPKETLPIIMKLAKSKLKENKRFFELFAKERESMKDLYTTFKVELQHDSKPLMQAIMNRMEKLQVVEIMTDYFKRCQEAGNMRKDVNPLHVTQLFLKLIAPTPMPGPGMFRMVPMHYSKENLDEYYESQLDILLNGIM